MTQFELTEALEPRLLLSAGGGVEPLLAAAPRTVVFAGQLWNVSADEQAGPGGNSFSDSEQSVWVDEQGLHLKIRNAEGTWYCAEAYTTSATRYAPHRFHVTGRPDLLDMNVVLGLSLQGPGGEGVDIQFSKWSQDDPPDNSQFVVRPGEEPGNTQPYNISLNGSETTHELDWQADSISFSSLHGHSEEPETPGHVIEEWTYTGPDIPAEDEGLTIHVALWLNFALPPSDQQEVEVVIAAADFANQMPALSSLSADRSWLIQGEPLTLTAMGVGDPDGNVAEVGFYRDANGDGVGQELEKLGEDLDGSDGWSWTGSADWDVGDHAFLAQATDDHEADSLPRGTSVTLEQPADVTAVVGTGESAQARAVTFTDPDGTRATVSLPRGTATLRFTQQSLSTAEDQDELVIQNGGVTLTEIVLDDVSARSTLRIRTGGGRERGIEVGRIVGQAPLGKLIAPHVDLTGSGIHMTGEGTIRRLHLHDLADGADIGLSGHTGNSGVSVRLHAVGQGSVVDILQGPLRQAHFTGPFRGVLSAGVDRGVDGIWFTDDDEVVTPVPVHMVRLARNSAGPADAGQPYGLLLGPQTRRVFTGISDRANVGQSIDGLGFEARVLPGPDCSISINDPPRGNPPNRRVSGLTQDVAPGHYKVVLYTWTDRWRLHRPDRPSIVPSSQGRWRATRVQAGDVRAYLVVTGFQAPEELAEPLTVDGWIVAATALWAE